MQEEPVLAGQEPYPPQAAEMRAESETGDGKHLSALADVYPDQRGADRGYQHHVYPGHRHRGMDCVPPYPGRHPAHQKVETGNIIL